MIIKSAGYGGLYTGWRLHFVRDTLGTALYFAEYDVMRHLLGRKRDGTSSREGDGLVQGDVPDWAKGWLPKGLIPFLCGSLAGVTSWALIYPVDVSHFLPLPALFPLLIALAFEISKKYLLMDRRSRQKLN